MTNSKPAQAKTFWIVTAFVGSVLIFVLFQFGRVWMAVRLSDFIERLDTPVPQAYLAVSGSVWLGAGLLTIWWLLRRHRFAPLSLKAVVVLYSVTYWLEQLWLTRSPLRTMNWAFSALLNAVILFLLFLILSHPYVRNIFGDRHGREPQNK